MEMCNLNVSNTTFSSNEASEKGGAIFYGYNRPNLTTINYFNNSASYGPEVASYAVKIKMKNKTEDEMKLIDVGSDVVISNNVVLEVLDYDNQVMVLDSSSQVIISPLNQSSSSVKGTNSVLLKQGVAHFDNLRLIAFPGSQNVEFKAFSKIIDSNLISNVFGTLISKNIISSNFRN